MARIVYALFRADVRVVDAYKKAALSRLLLESVTSTEPGERLDEKLAKLSLPINYSERECRHVTFPLGNRS